MTANMEHKLHFWFTEYSCFQAPAVLSIVTEAGLSEDQSQPQALLYSISDHEHAVRMLGEAV